MIYEDKNKDGIVNILYVHNSLITGEWT